MNRLRFSSAHIIILLAISAGVTQVRTGYPYHTLSPAQPTTQDSAVFALVLGLHPNGCVPQFRTSFTVIAPDPDPGEFMAITDDQGRYTIDSIPGSWYGMYGTVIVSNPGMNRSLRFSPSPGSLYCT